MVIIGITGGVASGKSMVTAELQRLGAAVVDADRLGHAVLALAEVKRALRERWGDSVIGPNQAIERSEVARRVFAPAPDGPRELAFLEQLTHPRIRQRVTRALDAIRNEGRAERVVLDAALLHEAGWDELCDWTLFVDCPIEQRIERARKRGWAQSDLEAREAVQRPLEFKRQRADLVISNAGTIVNTTRQVQSFWQLLDKTVN